MEISIFAFAGASDSFGFKNRSIPCIPEDTPLSIVQRLAPEVCLDSLRVALDCEFVTWETPLGNAKELAIIPPVSGG